MPLTLGAMMDNMVEEYQKQASLSPLDMRLINWHYANLEYANAVNVSQLSLGGWDQDGGNEFEGWHSQILGGYSQVPRGLRDLPFPLDIKLGKAVSKITYGRHESADHSHPATVECETGEYFNADTVVVTVPLGVLKDDTIEFQPPLPAWKTGAAQRLGFGLLNKVRLTRPRATSTPGTPTPQD